MPRPSAPDSSGGPPSTAGSAAIATAAADTVFPVTGTARAGAKTLTAAAKTGGTLTNATARQEAESLALRVAASRGYPFVDEWLRARADALTQEGVALASDRLEPLNAQAIPKAHARLQRGRETRAQEKALMLAKLAEMAQLQSCIARLGQRWVHETVAVGRQYLESLEELEGGLLDRRAKAEDWTSTGTRERTLEQIRRFTAKRAALAKRAAHEGAAAESARQKERARRRVAFESCLAEIRDVLGWYLQRPDSDMMAATAGAAAAIMGASDSAMNASGKESVSSTHRGDLAMAATTSVVTAADATVARRHRELLGIVLPSLLATASEPVSEGSNRDESNDAREGRVDKDNHVRTAAAKLVAVFAKRYPDVVGMAVVTREASVKQPQLSSQRDVAQAMRAQQQDQQQVQRDRKATGSLRRSRTARDMDGQADGLADYSHEQLQLIREEEALQCQILSHMAETKSRRCAARSAQRAATKAGHVFSIPSTDRERLAVVDGGGGARGHPVAGSRKVPAMRSSMVKPLSLSAANKPDTAADGAGSAVQSGHDGQQAALKAAAKRKKGASSTPPPARETTAPLSILHASTLIASVRQAGRPIPPGSSRGDRGAGENIHYSHHAVAPIVAGGGTRYSRTDALQLRTHHGMGLAASVKSTVQELAGTAASVIVDAVVDGAPPTNINANPNTTTKTNAGADDDESGALVGEPADALIAKRIGELDVYPLRSGTAGGGNVNQNDKLAPGSSEHHRKPALASPPRQSRSHSDVATSSSVQSNRGSNDKKMEDAFAGASAALPNPPRTDAQRLPLIRSRHPSGVEKKKQPNVIHTRQSDKSSRTTTTKDSDTKVSTSSGKKQTKPQQEKVTTRANNDNESPKDERLPAFMQSLLTRSLIAQPAHKSMFAGNAVFLSAPPPMPPPIARTHEEAIAAAAAVMRDREGPNSETSRGALLLSRGATADAPVGDPTAAEYMGRDCSVWGENALVATSAAAADAGLAQASLRRQLQALRSRTAALLRENVQLERERQRHATSQQHLLLQRQAAKPTLSGAQGKIRSCNGGGGGGELVEWGTAMVAEEQRAALQELHAAIALRQEELARTHEAIATVRDKVVTHDGLLKSAAHFWRAHAAAVKRAWNAGEAALAIAQVAQQQERQRLRRRSTTSSTFSLHAAAGGDSAQIQALKATTSLNASVHAHADAENASVDSSIASIPRAGCTARTRGEDHTRVQAANASSRAAVQMQALPPSSAITNYEEMLARMEAIPIPLTSPNCIDPVHLGSGNGDDVSRETHVDSSSSGQSSLEGTRRDGATRCATSRPSPSSTPPAMGNLFIMPTTDITTTVAAAATAMAEVATTLSAESARVSGTGSRSRSPSMEAAQRELACLTDGVEPIELLGLHRPDEVAEFIYGVFTRA